MYTCQFCGFTSTDLEDFEEDNSQHKGFFCPYCDGFTYFETEKENHNFSIIYETPCSEQNVGSRKASYLKTQVSPLRWPGGKSKVVVQILDRCNPSNMENFIEPFAGGASVGLSLLQITERESCLSLDCADESVIDASDHK